MDQQRPGVNSVENVGYKARRVLIQGQACASLISIGVLSPLVISLTKMEHSLLIPVSREVA